MKDSQSEDFHTPGNWPPAPESQTLEEVEPDQIHNSPDLGKSVLVGLGMGIFMPIIVGIVLGRVTDKLSWPFGHVSNYICFLSLPIEIVICWCLYRKSPGVAFPCALIAVTLSFFVSFFLYMLADFGDIG